MKKIRTIDFSDIVRCPAKILVPAHFRDDGRCRCDDPDHHEMKDWGYIWDSVKELWVAA